MARKITSAREAARRIHRARKELAAARRALAEAPRPRRAPHSLFVGEWQAANAALERNRGVFAKIPGVIGHGLGHRVKNGVETDEPCVVVFVRKKKALADLKREGSPRVPRSLAQAKKRIATDVVEMALLVRQAGPQSIAVPGSGDFGTIGAVGTDLDSPKPMAITAMHVSGLPSLDIASGDQPVAMVSPSTGGVVGQLVRGTTTGVDAAKIVFDDTTGLAPPLQMIGSRPVSNDVGISVRLFGAASQKILTGTISYLNVNLEDGGESLVNAIIASIATVHGDSGAGLVDNAGYLLGILFGEAPAALPSDLRVFSPASAVMSYLRCSIP